MRFPLILLSVLFLCLPSVSVAAEGGKKSIQVTFLPPPLENASFSVGIYEAKSGKLIRRLHEAATEESFTAGLNGLITKWDGKDDAGKTVPAGRYAARGYGVGPLGVEGLEFLGNEWTDEDESLRLRHIEAIALVPDDDGLAAVGTLADGTSMLVRLSGTDGAVIWKQKLLSRPEPVQLSADEHGITLAGGLRPPETYGVADGAKAERVAAPGTEADRSIGREGTVWFIDADTLYQFAKDTARAAIPDAVDARVAMAVRGLAGKEHEPAFKAVSASASRDRIYLLEEMPGWQRVRGLSWVEAREENGKKVSDWDTFFERSIRPAVPARGLGDPAVAKAAAPVKLELVENPLSPGKRASAELSAAFDEKGSYLVSADGLRLRRISRQADLKAVKLVAGEKAKTLVLYQYDGAVWEEFAITGADQMMAFDAGEIEMSANGEKPAETKNAEGPDF